MRRCNSILLFASIVQFVVIILLIFKLNNSPHNIAPQDENVAAKINSLDKIFPSKSSSTLPVVQDITDQETKKPSYAGVAATLMLHAPTWFQRRYTMMVQNAHNNLPPDWVIQIFYTAEGQSLAGIEINRGIARLVEQGRVVLTTIPSSVLKIKRKRFELMTEQWIWENMLAEKVLTFGGGSVMCSNSPFDVNDFLSFDYIGAPWNAFKGVGGDGSISLRNKSLMVKVIEYETNKHSGDPEKQLTAFKKWGQEDHFFVSRILEMKKKGLLSENVRIAERNDSMRFAAIGGTYNDDVFAVSGTLPDVPFKERDKFLSLCPEIKMFYPSLHDPNCFGAQPNGEKCAKSICALKSRSERKGGC